MPGGNALPARSVVTALRGSTSRGFDFAAFLRRAEAEDDPGDDIELHLYLVEQLPPARYEALASVMMLDSVPEKDAEGVEITGCVPGACRGMAGYLRAEPSGAVWAAVYGEDRAVVVGPRKAAAEPESLGRWLAEHEAKRVVRERWFE